MLDDALGNVVGFAALCCMGVGLVKVFTSNQPSDLRIANNLISKDEDERKLAALGLLCVGVDRVFSPSQPHYPGLRGW